MSWWSDLVLAVEASLGGESNVESTSGPATATVPSGLGGLITVIEGIWAGLTDGKMWRSLGWLLLGILLMLIGVVILARAEAGQIAREII